MPAGPWLQHNHPWACNHIWDPTPTPRNTACTCWWPRADSGTHEDGTLACRVAGCGQAAGQGGQERRRQGGCVQTVRGSSHSPCRGCPAPYLPCRASGHQVCVPPRSWRRAGKSREQETGSSGHRARSTGKRPRGDAKGGAGPRHLWSVARKLKGPRCS